MLIVDDHPMTRAGIRAQLSAGDDFEVCGEAGSLAEARQWLWALNPDLLVLDAHLPDGDALAFLEELRSRPERPKVFVLYEQDGITEQALRLGAGAVVSKRTTADEILKLARRVASGQTVLSDDMIQRLVRRRPRGED